MTAARAPAGNRRTTITVVATIGVAAACWPAAVNRMAGMDMGVDTELGPLASFAVLWMLMMPAMMLPGTAAAVGRLAHRYGVGRAAKFALGYLVVWTIAGLAGYVAYRPHDATAAGVLAIAAGCYELTPLKRFFRNRCRASADSGFTFGFCCLGSSLGLMVLLLAVGVMSVGWMAVVAVLVTVEKLTAPRRLLDIALALALVALGVVITIAPTSIPGLMPSM